MSSKHTCTYTYIHIIQLHIHMHIRRYTHEVGRSIPLYGTAPENLVQDTQAFTQWVYIVARKVQFTVEFCNNEADI